MRFFSRSLGFGLGASLAFFFIFANVSEFQDEKGNPGGSRKPDLQTILLSSNRSFNLEAARTPPSSTADRKPPLSISHAVPPPSEWRFNKTLANLIRKNILKFLDAERDISILKGILKAGDVVHYVFDRQRTTNISDSLYQLLPKVSPMKNQHHKRCAIVGNSGILLNSSCGQEIDSHDFVIRCNLAPVEGYEHDVGHRSSLVTMNPSVVQRAFHDLSSEQWRQRFLWQLHGMAGGVLWIPAFMAKGGEERVERTARLILRHGPDVRPAFPSLRLLDAVRGYWLTNKVQIKRPTMGLLMYTMATRFCEEIHLYGFWPFPLGPRGEPMKYHYYDSLTYKYTSQASPHTMPLEFKTLRALHRQGALCLHVGTCSTRTRGGGTAGSVTDRDLWVKGRVNDFSRAVPSLMEGKELLHGS